MTRQISSRRFAVNMVCAAFLFVLLSGRGIAAGEQTLKALIEEPYKQKIATKFTARDGLPDGPIAAIAICGGNVFAGGMDGAYLLAGEKWEKLVDAEDVQTLSCGENGASVLVASGEGVYSIPAGGGAVAEILRQPSRAAAAWRGGVLAAPRAGGLLFVKDGRINELPAFKKLAVRKIAIDARNGAWAVVERGVARYDGENLNAWSAGGKLGPVSFQVRDVFAAPDGNVYFATDRGISVRLPGGAWSHIRGGYGSLPLEDVTAVAVSGGVMLAGFGIGAARRGGTGWEYFQSGRWLPDDRVLDAAISEDGSLWLATGRGVSRIEYRTMTLLDKAGWYLPLAKLFDRHGFVGDAALAVPGDMSTIVHKTHDNENVWAGMFLAAECFHYAVTGDVEAKKRARRSLDALLFLETVTGVPGLFGRSFATLGEPRDKGGEWHTSPDGKWMWKGDASSDEAVGRFFGFSVYHDVCADDEEKRLIAGSAARTMKYIIQNDYFLIDIDGEPTRWGLWNPKYLATEGKFQKNLNSLEILMMLKTAYDFTGDEEFQKEYMRLIRDYGYARNTINAKIHQPRIQNHSDDLLAFLSYYPLLKYEKDGELLDKYYYKSIRRTWRIVREKKNPLWNFVYGAVMPPGEDFDPAGGVWYLQRLPMDIVYWDVRNSQRMDIIWDTNAGSSGEKQSFTPLAPDESFMLKFNENPYRLDGYWHGDNIEVPTFFLLPYWMFRYHFARN